MQAAQVTDERQERGATLVRDDMAVEPVCRQVVAAHRMADTVRAGVGRPTTPTPRRLDITFAGSDRGLLLARMRLQVERPELIHADDHCRIARPRHGFAIGDRVELEDPVLLRLEVRVVRLLERLIT